MRNDEAIQAGFSARGRRPYTEAGGAREKRRRFLCGLFLAWLTGSLSLFFTAPAYAWGPEGHAVVADIALDHLAPAARDELRQLLGDTNLAAISSWADEIRSALPETAPWHYVDIPSSADGYLAARDCAQDNCVVPKILRFSQILRDPKQSSSAHVLALKFLVHLVGDIHQPFHALADARGGNDIPVNVFGALQCAAQACNLHGAWDFDLINHIGWDEHQYTAYLEKTIAGSHLDAGAEDPAQWANDSWKLAKEALVSPGANLDERYYTVARPVIDRQLALAGLRLARLLNQDLGGDPVEHTPPPGHAPADTTKPK